MGTTTSVRVRVRRGSAIAAASLLLCVAGASGQDAGTIIDRMLDAYEEQTQGIDDYTLVQRVMGFETISYFVKEMVDGRPVFRLREASAAGAGAAVEGSSPGGLDELYAGGEDFKKNATYLGRDEVDGHAVHVLAIDDLSNSAFGRDVVAGEQNFVPTEGRLYLDVESYVPRRMAFDGELTNADGVHEVTSTMDLLDYRQVDGMMVAYHTVITVDGLGGAIDEEARAQFEEMQRQLENMPPSQRAMVESMMAEQLDQFRAMMSGEDESIVVEVAVQEVRVNAGPPGGG